MVDAVVAYFRKTPDRAGGRVAYELATFPFLPGKALKIVKAKGLL